VPDAVWNIPLRNATLLESVKMNVNDRSWRIALVLITEDEGLQTLDCCPLEIWLCLALVS